MPGILLKTGTPVISCHSVLCSWYLAGNPFCDTWTFVRCSEPGKWGSILLAARNINVTFFSWALRVPFLLSHRHFLSLAAANDFIWSEPTCWCACFRWIFQTATSFFFVLIITALYQHRGDFFSVSVFFYYSLWLPYFMEWDIFNQQYRQLTLRSPR